MKTKMMIVFLLLFDFCFGQKSDYWGIVHIGAQTKAVYPIAIIEKGSDTSKIKENLKFYGKIIPYEFYPSVIDTFGYKYVSKFLEQYKDDLNKKKNKIIYFGSIKVTRFVNGKAQSCFEIREKDITIQFLNTLKTLCSGINENLINDVERMICYFKQIGPC